MSLAEILEEIPRLTSAERQRVAEKLFEFEGDWIEGDDALSPEEKHLLDSLLADHDRDPASAVPWEEVKARFVHIAAAMFNSAGTKGLATGSRRRTALPRPGPGAILPV